MSTTKVFRYGISLAKIFVLVIPALPLVSVVLATRVGPAGAGLYVDSDWYYLFGGLQALSGSRLFFMDHPGVPAQLLAGFFLAIQRVAAYLSLAAPASFTAESLAAQHAFIGNCILAANSAALFFFGWTLTRWGLSLFSAFFCQSLFLLNFNVIIFAGRLNPEGVAIFLVTIFSILWLRAKRSSGGGSLAAFVLGSLFNNKLIYLVYAPLIFDWPASKRWRVLSGAVLVAFFYLFFLVEPRLWRSLSYFPSVVTRTGLYGSGDVGFPGPSALVEGVRVLARESMPLFLYFSFAAVLILITFFRARKKIATVGGWTVFVLPVALLLNIFVVTKLPVTRYLLPLSLLLPAIVAQLLLNTGAKWRARGSALGAIIAALFFWQADFAVKIRELALAKEKAELWALATRDLEREHASCLRMTVESTTSPAWAAGHANRMTGFPFTAELASANKNFWWYRPKYRAFENYEKIIANYEFAEHRQAHSCLLLQWRHDIADGKLEDVFPRHRSRLLLRDGANEVYLVEL